MDRLDIVGHIVTDIEVDDRGGQIVTTEAPDGSKCLFEIPYIDYRYEKVYLSGDPRVAPDKPNGWPLLVLINIIVWVVFLIN